MFVNFNVINQLGSPAIYEDILEQRPPASYPGRLFFSTDAKGIFRDTGTQWDLLASSGSPLDWDGVLDLGGNFTANRYADIGAFDLTFGNISILSITSKTDDKQVFLIDDAGNTIIGDIENINNDEGNTFVIDQKNSAIYTNGLFVDGSAVQQGLYMRFDPGFAIYKFGDFTNQNNNNALIISDYNNTIYTQLHTGLDGIYLEYSDNVATQATDMYFGEQGGLVGMSNYTEHYSVYDPEANTSELYNINYLYDYDGNEFFTEFALISNTSNGYYKFQYQGNNIGQFLQFSGASYNFYYGDPENTFAAISASNTLRQYFDDSGENYIVTSRSGITDRIGLLLDFNAKVYAIGDYDGIDDGTNIHINDSNQQVTIMANGGLFLNGSFTSGSAGGNSGQHLTITINGTAYKIALLNP